MWLSNLPLFRPIPEPVWRTLTGSFFTQKYYEYSNKIRCSSTGRVEGSYAKGQAKFHAEWDKEVIYRYASSTLFDGLISFKFMDDAI